MISSTSFDVIEITDDQDEEVVVDLRNTRKKKKKSRQRGSNSDQGLPISASSPEKKRNKGTEIGPEAQQRPSKAKSRRDKRNRNKSTNSQQDVNVDVELSTTHANDDGVMDSDHWNEALFPPSTREQENEEHEQVQMDNVEDEGIMDFIPFADGVWYRRNDRGSILLLLEAEKRVYFSGKVELQVIKGKIEVLGYILSPSSGETWTGENYPLHRENAFSPKGHSSLLYIEGKDCGHEEETMANDDNVNIVPDGFAAVILRSFENEWTLGLRNTAPNGCVLVGPEINVNNQSHPRLVDAEGEVAGGHMIMPKMKQFLDKFGFQLVPEKLLDKNRLFTINPSWESLFERIRSDRINAGNFSLPEKLCVFGGKGVGKSTFCRWFINKSLSDKDNKVLYIDLDPGQTEFTPPGVVSLSLVSIPVLGPNFSHMRKPEKAVFLGGVSVADFPVLYLQAVMELARFASENFTDIPWIINTMGFSTGLGVPLAISVIKIFSPSIVIQLSSPNNPKSSFPFSLNAHNISTYILPHFLVNNVSWNLTQTVGRRLEYNFLRIESVIGKGTTQSDFKHSSGSGESPKLLRDTMLISYFSGQIGNTPEQNVLSVIPHRVKLDSVTIGCMNSNLDWEGILRTLVGNLVALCKLPEEAETSNYDLSKKYIPSCSIHNINEFLGYGLCRAADKKAHELLLITPLPQEELDKVNIVICAGDVGVPFPLVLGRKNEKPRSHSYVSGQLSRLNVSGKKQYIPGKTSTHTVLRNSLLQ